jgi:endonuclease/exonuclease/phosphatase family metal-dependent hydrolase
MRRAYGTGTVDSVAISFPGYVQVMRALQLCLLGLFGLSGVTACRLTTHEPPPDAYSGPDGRIATFNVRRLFDTVCESVTCEPGAYEEQPTQGELDARATQIADAIRALDADVIALQEIETQACLDALLSRLGDVMPYGVLGEISEVASVDVAILSKTPIELVAGHRAMYPFFSRELLEAHVRVGGVPVVMLAAHFKAKSNDDPPRRLAEAQASADVVNAIAALEPTALVVLGGDLNDTPGSPPLDALVVDGGLVRVADDISDVEQATYIYNGRLQAIDHLLIAPNGASRRISRSAKAWRGPNGGYGGSDHFALTWDFATDQP